MAALAELLGSRHAAEAVLTFFAAMIPVLELRFAIPFGVARGLRLWTSIWASVLGNLVPVPFIVVFITRIFAWLRSLPLHLDVEVGGIRYRLVHAAPEEMAPAGEDARQFALWQRVLPEDPLPGDVTVIFGHTPTIHYQEDTPLRIWYGNRRIGVDCGSGYPEITPVCGRLACLRLEDMKEFYSEM